MCNSSNTSSRLFFTTITTLLSLTLFAITANILSAAAKLLGRDFGIEEATLVGQIFPIQFTAFILFCFLGGAASDRWGKRLSLLVSCLLVTFGCIAVFTATGLWQVRLGAVVIGMGGGVLETVCSAALTDLHPSRSKLFMNLSQVFYCIGAISISFIVGFLAEHGYRWQTFYTGLCIFAALNAIGYHFARFPKKESETKPKQNNGGGLSSLKELLPAVWLPSLAVFMYVYAETSFYAFGPKYFSQLGASDKIATLSIAVFWGSVVIGRIACSFLPQKQNYEPVILILFLCAGLSALGQCLVTGTTGGFILYAITGLACSGTWPLLVSLVAVRNIKYSGTASGIAIGFGAVGCVLSPLTLGSVFANGNTHLAFALLGSSFLLGVICTIGIWFQYRRQQKH